MAHLAAEDPLAGMCELGRVQADPLIDGRHPHHHQRPVPREQRQRLFHDPGVADRHHHHVESATVGERERPCGSVLLRGVDRVRCPERPRLFQLVVGHVDGHEREGTGERRTLNAVEPDSAAADHRDRIAHLHSCGVDGRAEAGHDTAGDQARGLVCDVRRNPDRLRGIDHHAFGESADPQPGPHRPAVLIAETRGRIDGERGHALGRASRLAVRAAPA